MKSFPQPAAVTLLVVIGSTCLLLCLFQKMLWLVVPGLLSLMVYYCLRPAVRTLVVCGVRHGLAVKCTWLLLQLTTAAGVLATVLILLARAGTWQACLVRYLAGGRQLVEKTTTALEQAFPFFQRMHLSAQADQHMQAFTDQFAAKNLVPFTLLLVKWLPSLLLIPFIIYYLLNDSARLKKYVIKSVPNAFFEKALLLFSRLDASLQNYFQGLLLLTLLEALSLATGLRLLGMPNAWGLGLGAAVLAWIPYLGSVIGSVAVVLVAATDHPEKLWLAYACLGLFLAVRLLDDFIFLPLTVGRKLHIHPVLSVLMLFLGAAVAGATGLVLALPLFSVVSVIGEALAQVVTDRKLRARFRSAPPPVVPADRG